MNLPTHHITIVSEQLWPHLLGLNYLRHNGGVKSVHLLHTDDEKRSLEPAKRLKAVAHLLLPGVDVHLHPTVSLSQSVYEKAGEIMAAHPVDNWTINCTGGTKMMLAGLLPHLENKNVRAFYREASGDWYQLDTVQLPGQRMVSSTLWRDPAVSRLSLPVIDLVKAQGLYPDGAVWINSPAAYCDTLKVIRAGIDNNWNWKGLFPFVPCLPQAGFAFEVLFASLLKSLGVENLESQLKLFNNGTPVQEFDIVASTGRKLVLFDLKLKNEDDKAKIDQLSRIAENRRSLGGLGGAAVAVRPSWGKSDSLKAIAQAYHIELWTATDMHNIVEKLARSLDIDLNSASHEINEIRQALAAANADGRRIFTSVENAPQMRTISYEERVGEINITTYHNALKNEENKPLTVIACAPWLIVYGAPLLLKQLKDRQELKALWAEAHYSESHNKVSAILKILPKFGKDKEIKRIVMTIRA